MSNHTPGPWSAEYDPEDEMFTIRSDEYGEHITSVAVMTLEDPGDGGALVPDSRWASNARVIAAAPEMYAALEMLEARAETGDLGPLLRQEISAARRALYKARGEDDAQNAVRVAQQAVSERDTEQE